MRLEDIITIQDNIMRPQQPDGGEKVLGRVKECTAKKYDLVVKLIHYKVCKPNLERKLEEQVVIMNALRCSMKQLEKKVSSLEVNRKLLHKTVEKLMRNCFGGEYVLRKTAGRVAKAVRTYFAGMAVFVSGAISR